jgi:methyl-accepting chemotaxis protein
MADSTVNESAKVQQALENILGAVGMIVDQTGRSLLPPNNRPPCSSDIDQHRRNQPGRRAHRRLRASQSRPALSCSSWWPA